MAEDLPSLTMAQIQEIAESMSKSATNLYRLLENLLQWSRMQQGSIPFHPQLLQLLPVAEDCIAMATEAAKNKGIEITSIIPKNLKVFADKNMLQTVIRNLVSNAVKFSHKNGMVNISARITKDNEVEITVSDTGIGMSQAMVSNLFRLDVQSNRKGTDDEPSTGLGLLLCKEFVEKHVGQIWVESEEEDLLTGKAGGSIFHFTLQMNA
jgi:signal transduction histidine kinase